MATTVRKTGSIIRVARAASRRAARGAQQIAQRAVSGGRVFATRVYSSARGGIGSLRGIAANAKARASSILSGGIGRIIAIGVSVAAMVALIPVLKSTFRLKGPNASYYLGALYAGLAVLLWRVFRKPQLALAAGAVAGFVLGSEILEKAFLPLTQTAMSAPQPSAALPDRVPTPTPSAARKPIVAGQGRTS